MCGFKSKLGKSSGTPPGRRSTAARKALRDGVVAPCGNNQCVGCTRQFFTSRGMAPSASTRGTGTATPSSRRRVTRGGSTRQRAVDLRQRERSLLLQTHGPTPDVQVKKVSGRAEAGRRVGPV